MLKVLTCNIRTCDARDGDNGWEFRRQLCTDVIRRQNADIIGFQEMRWPQFCDLREALPEYDHRVMVDSTTTKNPPNTIFYRRGRFEVLSSGGYWLSQTPHVAGSRSWDSAHVRYANWLRAEDRESGMHFRLVNTHLDNKSQPAREGQARILCEDAAAYPDDFPQMLMGDFNCDVTNRAIEILESGGWQDSYAEVHGNTDPGFTFHQFKGVAFNQQARIDQGTGVGKIDWIYYRGNLAATAAEVVRDCDGERYPSDHYFVSATLESA